MPPCRRWTPPASVPPGGQYLHLVRDALALGYPAEVLDELRVGDGVAVHDLERGPLA